VLVNAHIYKNIAGLRVCHSEPQQIYKHGCAFTLCDKLLYPFSKNASWWIVWYWSFIEHGL